LFRSHVSCFRESAQSAQCLCMFVFHARLYSISSANRQGVIDKKLFLFLFNAFRLECLGLSTELT
jgi:hypothetical protein